MNFMPFLHRLTIVTLAVSLTHGEYAKCTAKDDCKNFCAFTLGDCYAGGLCKCYDIQGQGQPPNLEESDGRKCVETKSGSCKTACNKSKTKVLKNPNAYTCTKGGKERCFCKFELNGKLTKCDQGDDDAKICKTKDAKPESKYCEGEVKCEGLDSCTCQDGDILATNKVCEDEPYCKGVCKADGEKKGKLCTVTGNKKVCVCYGEL